MKRLLCIAVIWFAGCGTIYPLANGEPFFTTQHGSARFNDAMQGAMEYCAKQGLTARHLRTDVPIYGQALSRFQCV